ncbi:uncharacterized protein LOC134241007 [Saccostrea cucullata]|uniref:uncharacterized protein LOC134241007 n=1 Tax=Saccostrea cuccullata TaxID=36930 RepID=UPI002ED376EA
MELVDDRKRFPCVLCKKRTKPNDRRKCESIEIRKFLRKTFMVDARPVDVLCNKCRHYYYKNKKVKQKPPIHAKTDNEPQGNSSCLSPPSVTLPLQRTVSSHAYCFICKRPGPKLIVVPVSARLSAFIHKEVIIPSGSRCCPSHIANDDFIAGALDNLQTIETSFLNRSTIVDLITRIRNYAIQNCTSKFTFNPSYLNNLDYITLTGIPKDQFADLHQEIKSEIRNTPSRTSTMSLGIFLLKMRSGMSNQLMSTIFGISKSSIRRAISTVRTALMKKFVPQNVGLQHISRQEVIANHTRPLAQSLFRNVTQSQAIAVLDGTYIFIQKSNNFQFQRRTYNMHKVRPLVKPMVVVSTDGYFLTVVGPYLADSRNNDAAILNHMLKSNIEDIKNWFQDEDIFIVDMGFRDALGVLEEFGIKAYMPHLLAKGEKQMPTPDANASRLVTKIRWVVEAANSRIKRWKYLAHTLPTNQVPFIGDYVRIVCAISNKYLPPLSTGNADDDEALANKMQYLSKRVNILQIFVEENALDKRSSSWEVSSDSLNVPKLDEEELRNLTCGVYQLRLCPSYIQEYIEGDADILVHKEHPGLIRVKLQSRHISSKKYMLWIQYTESAVTAWYCKCCGGARVVGVCSHIASVVWYLGFARHNVGDVSATGIQNWGEYVKDAAVIDASDNDDSDIEE